MNVVGQVVVPVRRTEKHSSVGPTAVPAKRATAPTPDPLEQLAHRRSSQIESFTPLRGGAFAWETRLAQISQARTSIVNTTYVIEPDAHGIAYLDALIAARKRGVEVVLVIDSLAMQALRKTTGPEVMNQLEHKLEALQACGGHVGWTGTFDEQLAGLGHGSHFKCLVVDGKRAIVGGRNIGGNYVEAWTDFEALVTGPIASQLGAAALVIAKTAEVRRTEDRADAVRGLTAAIVRLETKQLALSRESSFSAAHGRARGVPGRFILAMPGNGENPIRDALGREIDQAKTSIVLSSNNFNAHPELLAKLEAAAARGVDIKIVTTGKEATPFTTLPYYNSELLYPDLSAAGISIYETSALEHGKMYLFDGKRAAFGSYNMELSADDKLYEGLLFSSDPQVVSSVGAALSETIATKTTRYDPVAKPVNLWTHGWKRLAAYLLRWSI